MANFLKATLSDVNQPRTVASDSGIVYCRTRAETEAVSAELCQLGLVTQAYHAGLKVSVEVFMIRT